MRRIIDPKIDRIRSSWLDLDTTDATWLASVADELSVNAGTPLGDHRFTHLVMTGDDAGIRIDAGDPPVTLGDAASVLVLTAADAGELDQRCPAAATARRGARTSRATSRSRPARRASRHQPPHVVARRSSRRRILGSSAPR